MKQMIIYSLAIGVILASRGFAYADHSKDCKNVHGKVTVVTDDGITVNDKLYKVGKTTRLVKEAQVVKLEKIAPGDIVCVDTRGKDDVLVGSEVASVTVLSATDPLPKTEKEYVREKETVRQVAHDKSCNRLHGKVTRIEGSTIYVEDKSYPLNETIRITKDGQTTKIESLKAGDFVCMDTALDGKTASVVVLSPAEATQFQTREVIREKEQIREVK